MGFMLRNSITDSKSVPPVCYDVKDRCIIKSNVSQSYISSKMAKCETAATADSTAPRKELWIWTWYSGRQQSQDHKLQWDPGGTQPNFKCWGCLAWSEATPHARHLAAISLTTEKKDQLRAFTLPLIMISNTVCGDVSFTFIPTCTMHYYSLSMLFQPSLFHSPLSVLTPLHCDGEVPQEVAEHTFLTESLFKLNLNDPLSS